MKNFIFIFLVVIASACNDSSNKASSKLVENPISASDTSNAALIENAPYMKFEENIFDFGKIMDGEIVEHKYNFTNTGKNDLIISNATASCGCTVPSYPKKPIKPGELGEINVRFDSKGKAGIVEKTVTITANTVPTESNIIIKGEVLTKK